MTYLTQMLGLTVQSFLSAATGMAVALVLIRGFVSRSSTTIGNFWIDLTRSTLYILLPLSLGIAIVLLGQAVGPDRRPRDLNFGHPIGAKIRDEIAIRVIACQNGRGDR